MKKINHDVYQVAKALKDFFTNISEGKYGNDRQNEFYEYLTDQDFPAIVEYVEHLVNEKMIDEEFKYVAMEYLSLAIGDSNDSLFNRLYIYEQGNSYYPQWSYGIPSTKNVIDAISIYFKAEV